MWTHSCGWTGDTDQLKPSIWQGIKYGLECPQCGDEWPFWYDEDWSDEEDGQYEYCPRNRIKSQLTNKAKFWCPKCDQAKVGKVGKCSNCGSENI